tara:strand:- start:127 stop:489 length:363 start_codon:yes stop_codon:yes gene_type:complete
MLKSIVTTVIISCLIGFGLSGWISFWQAFALVTGIQFVSFWFLNSYQVTNKDALYAEFEEQVENILSLSRVSQDCPCNDYTFDVEIFANTENIFQCPKCKNNIELGMMKTPILKTDPTDI